MKKIFGVIPATIKKLLSNKIISKVVLFIGCLVIGFGIGFNLENIIVKVSNIKNKKVEVAKEDKEKEEVVENKEKKEEKQEKEKDKEKDKKEDKNKEKDKGKDKDKNKNDNKDKTDDKEKEVLEVKEDVPKKELEEKEAMESLQKINTKYKIEKARHFLLKETGESIGELVYIGDESPDRIDGEYYIFGILEDGCIIEDSKFYVDKETFKVYEESIKDKYFGEYRGI